MRKNAVAFPVLCGLAFGLLLPPLLDASAASNSKAEASSKLQRRIDLANKGNAPAQFNLGLVYSIGQGVPQDYIQAHKWYNLAAARYTALETEYRDKAVKYRDIVSAKMTPGQIAEAQKLARE